MAKARTDDLPDLTKPAIPAKGEPYPAERPAGLRTVQVTIEIPLVEPGEGYLPRQVNAKLVTLRQQRLLMAIVNGLAVQYPLPPGTNQKKVNARAVQYLLNQIAAQVTAW